MEEARELVERFVEAFNQRDAEAIKAIFSPDVVWVVPGATLRGWEQIVGLEQAFWQAFPDGWRTIDRLVAEGSTVVEEGSFTGSHLGTFRTPGGDIPPTERRVSFTYAIVYELREGRLASKHFYFDTLGLLTQLGTVPVPSGV